MDYCSLTTDLTVSLANGQVEMHDGARDDWTVQLIDTGQSTATGGRINRLAPYLGDGTFMLTWGDGVAESTWMRCWRSTGRTASLTTMTAVRPPASATSNSTAT